MLVTNMFKKMDSKYCYPNVKYSNLNPLNSNNLYSQCRPGTRMQNVIS